LNNLINFYIKSEYDKVMKKNIILTGMSFLIVGISLLSIGTAYAQNTNATGVIDVEPIKSLLDMASEALNNGDNVGALQFLDNADDRLEAAKISLGDDPNQ
jgi:hypothetical protein